MLSRRFLLIAAAGLAFAGTAMSTAALAAAPKPFDATAFAAAQKAGRPILIHVHATWCPTCKAQTPILDQLTGDAKFRNLAFFIVDFDSQKDVLQKFGVRAQSTLLAFKGDKETGRSAGDTNRASIATLLDKTL